MSTFDATTNDINHDDNNNDNNYITKPLCEPFSEPGADTIVEPGFGETEKEKESSTVIEILMDKLEQEGVGKVISVLHSEISPLTPNIFVKIMAEGAKEFKETIGRNMTYSEMRRMYG